jgi:translation initiation factor IF-2
VVEVPPVVVVEPSLRFAATAPVIEVVSQPIAKPVLTTAPEVASVSSEMSMIAATSQLLERQARELKCKAGARSCCYPSCASEADAAAVAATLAAEQAKQAGSNSGQGTRKGRLLPKRTTLHKKPDAPGKDAKKGGNARADESQEKSRVSRRALQIPVVPGSRPSRPQEAWWWKQ